MSVTHERNASARSASVGSTCSLRARDTEPSNTTCARGDARRNVWPSIDDGSTAPSSAILCRASFSFDSTTIAAFASSTEKRAGSQPGGTHSAYSGDKLRALCPWTSSLYCHGPPESSNGHALRPATHSASGPSASGVPLVASSTTFSTLIVCTQSSPKSYT